VASFAEWTRAQRPVATIGAPWHGWRECASAVVVTAEDAEALRTVLALIACSPDGQR
jgi:hypothetical protein